MIDYAGLDDAELSKHFIAAKSEMQRRRKKTDSAHKYSPEFLEFYKAYPRKTAKLNAWKVWQKMTPHLPTLAVTLKAVEALTANTDPEYYPHPATWLNAARWDDEYKVVTETRYRDLTK